MEDLTKWVQIYMAYIYTRLTNIKFGKDRLNQ